MSALLATTAGGGIATGGEVGETRYGGWGVGLRLLGHPEATRPHGSSLLPTFMTMTQKLSPIELSHSFYI